MSRQSGWRPSRRRAPSGGPVGLLVATLRGRVRRMTEALDAERRAHAHLAACADCAAEPAGAPAGRCEAYEELSAEALRRYAAVVEGWDAGL